MKRFQFSKLILGAVMLLFYAGAIFGGYIVANEHYGLGELFAYIGAPTATAIGFYAWKAKAENVIQISDKIKKEAEKDAKKGVDVNEETQRAIVGAVANALSNVLGGNNTEV